MLQLKSKVIVNYYRLFKTHFDASRSLLPGLERIKTGVSTPYIGNSLSFHVIDMHLAPLHSINFVTSLRKVVSVAPGYESFNRLTIVSDSVSY